MKIVRENLIPIVRSYQKRGRIVGFISGAFDLFHAMHLHCLKCAAQECDILIVGINTDNSIREYKNPSRPIIPEQDRLDIVANIKCVDFAFLFGEQNNNTNIELLRPDVYIKGSDYSGNRLTSQDIVESYGGAVKLVGGLGPGTTEIIERIRNANRS
jgi:D-beta-D-heptose 7-phosphate kinase/D-beta-D-heptose 1-phosphate adenosyltransferase